MFTTTAQRFVLVAALCFAGPQFAHGKDPELPEGTPKPLGSIQPVGEPVVGDNKVAASSRVFDFKITDDMKTSDLDDPKSALSKLITFIVKGTKAASEYVSVVRTNGKAELKLEIKDDSIFVPGGDAKNAQHGFRRTDVLPAIDRKTAFSGTTTFYQTIRFDQAAPLVLTHGYLLASIETPSGEHVWDIFAGSDFMSDNTAHKLTPNATTIRVRDLTTKTLFSFPLNYTITYTFAVMVDWTANQLTVFASEGNGPLRKVAGPMDNDPKVKAADLTKTEYHVQLIKFPLPDAKDPVATRSDVPHHGLQEQIKKEHVLFSDIFVTSGTEVEQPKTGGKKARPSRCK